MNEQIKNEKNLEINKNETNSETTKRPWELGVEDQSFFDRKFKALEYFNNKLNTTKEQSTESAKGEIVKFEQRVNNLDLDSCTPEEIATLKNKLGDLEKQKSEIIQSGQEEMKNIATEKANVEDVDYEEVEEKDGSKISKQPDTTENVKPEDEEAEDDSKKEIGKPTEKLKEKPLEPGDEVYSNGNFYKIYNIHTPTVEEEQKIWEYGKIKRDKEFSETSGLLPYKEGSERSFQERELFEEKKKKELKERGPIITAIIKGGEEKIELDLRNIIRVETPEQREKIVKMQKEEDGAESRAANFMGIGDTKNMVDKITEQPGKF